MESGSTQVTDNHRPASGRTGAVMMEFVISFPLILMLILGAVQLSHLWVARVVVHYAAYCAARTAIVSGHLEYLPAAETAAEQVCAWINVGDKNGVDIPGWGNIPGSGGVENNTRVTIVDTGDWNVRAEVQHDFGLITPIIGPLMSSLPSPALNVIPTEIENWDIPYPRLTLTETVYLPKPYRITTETEWPL